MRIIGLLFAFIFAWGGPALADSRDFQAFLDTAQRLPTVGQLTFEGDAPCTATLIASDEILTSAHCVTQSVGWEDLRSSHPEFKFYPLTGAEALSVSVIGARPHPTYSQQNGTWHEIASHNMAIFKLGSPIGDHLAIPARLAETLPMGGEVTILAPPSTSGEGPQLRHVCTLRGIRDIKVGMVCDQTVSTAPLPVFRLENNALRLVTIVSVARDIGGQNGVIGVDLGRLGFLRGLLRRGVHGNMIRDNDDQPDIGARFIRP